MFVDKQGKALHYKDSFSEIKDYKNKEIETVIATGDVLSRVEGATGWLIGIGEELSYYLPWMEKGRVKGGIKIVLPLDDIKSDMASIFRFVLFFTIADSIVLILFGVFLLSNSIVKPLNVLEETARRIAGGAFEERVPVKREDEIGGLSESFNSMAESLQEKIVALEKANENLREIQKDVIQAEKMATVGRLSAGIAHEIGNPLGAIQGYIDILLKGTKDEEDMDILQRLGWETERINSIVTNFLNISRPARIDLKEVDANNVISDTVAFFKESLKNITLNLSLDKTIPRIKIDEGQLRQVLINVILNAADSMPQGGTLKVETGITEIVMRGRVNSRRKDDPPHADYISLRNGKPVYTVAEGSKKVVRIAISDEGTGISEEDIERIFDPFFTTKEIGKGTGLGLTVSQGIIQAFGGEIKVTSNIGEGTTFEVCLPIT
jgi:two-component system NtrC family sensor kinase